jgi:hypothetical protein
MGGTCSAHGRDENAYRVCVGKSEGKGQLGRPRRRWEDNIRNYLRETGWENEEREFMCLRIGTSGGLL